jgi:hypothetical protein
VRLARACEALERAARKGDLQQARLLVSELQQAWAVTEVALQTGLQPSRR